MKAFDTDVLTEIFMDNSAYAERIASVPLDEQSAPVVAIEEILRGRLNVIRQAESGKARITNPQSLHLGARSYRAMLDLRSSLRMSLGCLVPGSSCGASRVSVKGRSVEKGQ